MARFNDLGEGKIEGRKLDPRTIRIREDFNYRDMESEAVQAHIEWLKESIRTHGVQEPIRVQYIGGQVFLVSGHCRVEACKRLFKEGVKVPYKDGGYGPPLVPAIVVQGDEAEILASSMVANDGLPPTKIEFGKGADQLRKLGWTVEKIGAYIAPHIGVKGFKADRYVREAIELHHAPIAVKKAATEGVEGVTLSEPAALKIARENPLNPEPAIQAEVEKAKAAGKKEAKRPKGAGAATKAKEAETKRIRSLEKIGDEMAAEILRVPFDTDILETLATEWKTARSK
jgi:hypothetical protein